MGWKVVQQSSGVPIPPGEPVAWGGVPDGRFVYNPYYHRYGFKTQYFFRMVDSSVNYCAGGPANFLVAPSEWEFKVVLSEKGPVYVPINDTRRTVFAKDCEPVALYQLASGEWLQCGGDAFYSIETGAVRALNDYELLYIPQGVVTLEYRSGE